MTAAVQRVIDVYCLSDRFCYGNADLFIKSAFIVCEKVLFSGYLYMKADRQICPRAV